LKAVAHRVECHESHERAASVWYRPAGLASRGQKDLAVEIIEAEIRFVRHEALLETIAIARQREREIALSGRDRDDVLDHQLFTKKRTKLMTT
jgi:hypothetical protein